MRKYNLLTWIVLVSLLWNCRGDQGPIGPQGDPGPQGPQGPAGPQTVALMYEFEFDLNTANQWEAFYAFPEEDIEDIFLEDVGLVYLLWDVVETDNGEELDVWRLMPVNFFNEKGILSMNFDYTAADVRVFLEGSYPLDATADMTDLLARIVIVPADYSPNGRRGAVNFENYNEVQKAFGLKEAKRVKGKSFMQIMREREALKK